MELRAISELVVYRDLWRRGAGKDTQLLGSGGMCCLGFACLAIGVPPVKLCGHGEPNELDIDDDIPGLLEADVDGPGQSSLVHDAIRLNDDKEITDDVRESGLRRLLSEHDIRLSFEDTAPTHVRKAYKDGLSG